MIIKVIVKGSTKEKRERELFLLINKKILFYAFGKSNIFIKKI